MVDDLWVLALEIHRRYGPAHHFLKLWRYWSPELHFVHGDLVALRSDQWCPLVDIQKVIERAERLERKLAA
jgi:hypothetical protein